MKYIAKCVEQQYSCGNEERCPHARPHEWLISDNSDDDRCFNDHNNVCDCFPVGLEYYMREIIKEHEEKK